MTSKGKGTSKITQDTVAEVLLPCLWKFHQKPQNIVQHWGKDVWKGIGEGERRDHIGKSLMLKWVLSGEAPT